MRNNASQSNKQYYLINVATKSSASKKAVRVTKPLEGAITDGKTTHAHENTNIRRKRKFSVKPFGMDGNVHFCCQKGVWYSLFI